jgi:hypothetical protein
MAPKKAAKRRSGGGRKPQGKIAGNGKVLNLRVRADVRSKIERAAQEHSNSLNQEAQERLIFTLDYDHKAPQLRALGFIIEMVAKVIEDKAHDTWTKNPYVTEMLRGAVDFLIRDFGAKGEAIVPASIAEEAERQRAESLNPSVDPFMVGAAEAGFLIGQIRARHYTSKVFNSIFNSTLSDTPKSKFSDYSGFDNLIRDLGL